MRFAATTIEQSVQCHTPAVLENNLKEHVKHDNFVSLHNGQRALGDMLFENLDLLTVEELAKAFRRAPKTIRNWVSKRQIPFVMLGRTVMFRRESIEAWLKRKEIKSWL